MIKLKLAQLFHFERIVFQNFDTNYQENRKKIKFTLINPKKIPIFCKRYDKKIQKKRKRNHNYKV
jgi:hypothetical protein